MDELWRKINETIHRRELRRAPALIFEYLNVNRHSQEAVYEASEFFRKITDYANALRVLPKELAFTASNLSGMAVKLQLQLARILNTLGASRYALRTVQRLRSTDQVKSKVEIAEIFLSNYKYSDVVDLLGERLDVPDFEPWHQDWLLHFYRADALAGLKEFDAAIFIVERIHKASESPLIRAIALGAKGEYLVRSGAPKKALPFLLQARGFFGDDDGTLDHGIALRWLGACLLALERDDEAKEALIHAFRILYRPGRWPESWLEAALWLDRIREYPQAAPQMLRRIQAMANEGHPLLDKTGLARSDVGDDVFSVVKIEKLRKHRHFDRASETAWTGRRARLGFDRVDELVWTLVYWGKYGIPQYRLYEILWPDEPFSFDQHQKRLEQLVIRARKLGYQIVWKDLHLCLKSADVTASGPPRQVVRGYPFLKAHAEFTRRDIEAYFCISRSSATDLCNSWIGEGLALLLPRSRYRSLL